MTALRLVVMGTTGFAVPALGAVLAAGHEVVAVYTQPPRPGGRGQRLQRTPMHEAAERLGLPVATPASLKDAEAQTAFAALGVDLAVVGAYGLILPRPVLAAPRLGCINLHASLLPRWRGAAPIERAILAGDAHTGLCIFVMEPGLDTGPVLARRAVPIGARSTAAELHAGLAELAARMLPAVLDGLAAGSLVAEPQPADGVSYAHKLGRDEGLLDFAEAATQLDRRLRALNPRPGCWCNAGSERLAVLEGGPIDGGGRPGEIIALPLTVACGEGALRIDRVRRPGRRPMGADELQRGFPLPPGTVLG